MKINGMHVHEVLEAMASDMENVLVIVRAFLEQKRNPADLLDVLEHGDESVQALFCVADRVKAASDSTDDVEMDEDGGEDLSDADDADLEFTSNGILMA